MGYKAGYRTNQFRPSAFVSLAILSVFEAVGFQLSPSVDLIGPQSTNRQPRNVEENANNGDPHCLTDGKFLARDSIDDFYPEQRDDTEEERRQGAEKPEHAFGGSLIGGFMLLVAMLSHGSAEQQCGNEGAKHCDGED